MYLTFNIVHPNGQQYLPLEIPVNWTAGQVISYLQQTAFLSAGNWRLSLDGAGFPSDLLIAALGEHNGATLHIAAANAIRVHFGNGRAASTRQILAQHPPPQPSQAEGRNGQEGGLFQALWRLLS